MDSCTFFGMLISDVWSALCLLTYMPTWQLVTLGLLALLLQLVYATLHPTPSILRGSAARGGLDGFVPFFLRRRSLPLESCELDLQEAIQRSVRCPNTVGVVLGSGGHTVEMLHLLQHFSVGEQQHWWKLVQPMYFYNDSHSRQAVLDMEQQLFERDVSCQLHHIPRARRVGQSYYSAVFSTLRSCLYVVGLLGKLEGSSAAPEVLLINGPGVCLPVVMSCLFWAVLCKGIHWALFIPSWALDVTLLISCHYMQHQKKVACAGSAASPPPPSSRQEEVIHFLHKAQHRLRRFLRQYSYERPAIVYFESMTCTSRASLTLRLLLWLRCTDIVCVQWDELLQYLKGTARGWRVTPSVRFRWGSLPTNESLSVSNVTGTGGRVGIYSTRQLFPLLVNVGVKGTTSANKVPLVPPTAAATTTLLSRLSDAEREASYTLVTVGTTCFSGLIETVLSPAFLQQCETPLLLVQYGTQDPAVVRDRLAALSAERKAYELSEDGSREEDEEAMWEEVARENHSLRDTLHALRLTEIRAHRPTKSSLTPTSWVVRSRDGVVVCAVPFLPSFLPWAQSASYVFGHAGAGTILECLRLYAEDALAGVGKPLLYVVPNRSLMGDHQSELAYRLADSQYVWCSDVDHLTEELARNPLATRQPLRAYEGINVVLTRSALSIPLTGTLTIGV